MTRTIVRLQDGLRTTIHNRQHVWHADEPTDKGGTDTAPTPMETALGALGSCVAITMRYYAERKGFPLEGIEIAIDHQRLSKGDYPSYTGEALFVHEIVKEVVLHGPLTDEQKDKIMEIGLKCPVSRLLTEPTFVVDRLLEAESLPE